MDLLSKFITSIIPSNMIVSDNLPPTVALDFGEE